MRLLVIGGRHLDDVGLIRKALSLVHVRKPVDVLIHGGHAFLGVAAEEWARERDIHILRYPANWRLLGKRAEGVRNDFMLSDSRPDMVLALPGGQDTRVLVLRAISMGLPVVDEQARPVVANDACGPETPSGKIVALQHRSRRSEVMLEQNEGRGSTWP